MLKPKLHTTLTRSCGGFDFVVKVGHQIITNGWILGDRALALATAEAEAKQELERREAAKAMAIRNTSRAIEVYEGVSGEYWMRRPCRNCED